MVATISSEKEKGLTLDFFLSKILLKITKPKILFKYILGFL
jgi:hypothetical protein